VLLGLGASTATAASLGCLVLLLVVALALFLIADIASPRRGVMRVVPQNLLRVSHSLRAP